MSFTMAISLGGVAVCAAGLCACAWSLVHGDTAQAIAWAWPTLGFGVTLAILLPGGSLGQRPLERGVKNGA